MTASSALRRGWCPGALRPMLTGDGLLARIRVSGGRLMLDQAEGIAQCAARFGNGMIEISSRANPQLRGIRETGLAALQERLFSLGLLDADETSESVRNIIASPIADLDGTAILDPAPLVAALEARLAGDSDLRALPAKFGFIIDGGGALPLHDVQADLRFAAIRIPAGVILEIGLAGDNSVVARSTPENLAAAASQLARAFLREAGGIGPDARRMRHVAGRIGAAALFQRAGLDNFAPLAEPRPAVTPGAYLGAHCLGASHTVGAAPALGRMRADALAMLARESRRLGARDIRLTPWRALIVTGLVADAARALAVLLDAAGFITDPDNPLLAIVACSGAPACANAARDVQADALALAQNLSAGRGIALHISGCRKGCAHAAPAPLTLVAQADGYDLVTNGRAGDAPALSGLSLDEIASLLARAKGPKRT